MDGMALWVSSAFPACSLLVFFLCVFAPLREVLLAMRGHMKIGVLGGGQLGRMLALAGYPLGLRFRFLDPAPEAPVEELAELTVGRFDDLDVLARFPNGLDVITYEF